MPSTDIILLGGGSGTRFSTGASAPKQFQLLCGAPVFIHALQSLSRLSSARHFVLAFPKAFLPLAESQLDTHLRPELKARVKCVSGGGRRQDSALAALAAIAETAMLPSRVLIHDACRPFLSDELLARLDEKIADSTCPAWIPTVPVVETLKRVSADRVVETVDRAAFHRVQTPQLFDFPLIWDLSQRAKSRPDLTFTDDASICEYYGFPVGTFPGDDRNLKLTYEFESEILERRLAERACSRSSSVASPRQNGRENHPAFAMRMRDPQIFSQGSPPALPAGLAREEPPPQPASPVGDPSKYLQGPQSTESIGVGLNGTSRIPSAEDVP